RFRENYNIRSSWNFLPFTPPVLVLKIAIKPKWENGK
ncbi:MAG: hypothetical protein ACJA2N_001623, partial [Salibacteraceae bacterium]